MSEWKSAHWFQRKMWLVFRPHHQPDPKSPLKVKLLWPCSPNRTLSMLTHNILHVISTTYSYNICCVRCYIGWRYPLFFSFFLMLLWGVKFWMEAVILCGSSRTYTSNNKPVISVSFFPLVFAFGSNGRNLHILQVMWMVLNFSVRKLMGHRSFGGMVLVLKGSSF